MKNSIRLLSLLAGLMLAACSGAATPTSESGEVPLVTDDFAVVAEGRLLPAQFANVSFAAGGKVAEILVREGQVVAADAVIARLEDSESLQAQVAQAQADVITARQTLDDLNDSAAMAKARAESDVAAAKKTLEDAERRLKNLNYPDITWYQEQIDNAQETLTTAQENVVLQDIGSLQAAHQAALDNQERFKERLDKVRDAVQACKECDPAGSFTVDGFPQTLDDAQDAYNDATNRLREIEIQMTQAQRGNSQDIEDAQEDLEDAVQDLEAAQRGPKPLDVEIALANASVARATLADAEMRLAKLQNGADPDQLAAAEARLAAAQASLASAQDALKNSEVRAPFPGVVADLKVKVGEQVTPGQVGAVLADFSGWVVETDNLTEIEVVRVAEGQQTSIVLDALPDVTLHGTVTSISPVFEEKRGDITYTVTIALTDGDPLMRWGMTAVTTFEK
jgi:multidrug resistance efflux pump